MIATLMSLLLVQAVAPPSQGPEVHCAGQERNLQRYQQMSKVLFNNLDSSRAGEFYADPFLSHNDDVGGTGTMSVRPADMAKMWNHIRNTELDRKLTDNLILCSGDLVMAQVTLSGNYVGEGMEGAPEDGRRFEQSAIDIYRFGPDGKVIERWGNNEALARIRQLGLKPDLSLRPLKRD